MPVWKLAGAADAQADPLQRDPHGRLAGRCRPAGRRSGSATAIATVKLKLGAGEDDVRTVEAVREAIGPEVKIRVDANEAWDARLATDLLKLIEPFGIELAEQPVAGLRAMARVAGETDVPLAADEAIASEADAHRAVQRRACRFATAKLSKVGGAGAARQIARVLPTYLSSALDGPVGIAAAAHAAQVLRADGTDPGIAHGLATQRLFAETIASRECELRDGELHLPGRPRPGRRARRGRAGSARSRCERGLTPLT